MCELLKQLQKKDIITAEVSSGCRYHKKSMERFKYGSMFGKFKCLELFHSVYPKALALMYDARFSEEQLIMACPSCKNTVTIRLHTEPIKSFAVRFLNKTKQMLHFLKPMDVVNKMVYAQILSIQGSCPAGHKEGERLEFYHRDTICPQALYSAFPSVLLSDADDICRCPSQTNSIVFRKTDYA